MIQFTEISIFFTVLLVTFIALALWKKKTTDRGKTPPPCLPTLPVVGSLPFMKGGGMDVLPDNFMQLGKKLGPVFSFYAFSKYVVVLNGKSVFDALLAKSEAFADRPGFWSEVNLLNIDQRGIIFAPYNEVYKNYHKLCLSIMKEFGFGVTHESDNRIWNEVETMIEKIRDLKSQPIDMKDMLAHSTGFVVLKMLFGEEFLKQENHIQRIVHGANEWVEAQDPSVDVLPLLRFIPFFKNKLERSKNAQTKLLASLDVAIKHNKDGKCSDRSFTKRFLEIQGTRYIHEDLLFILRDMCTASADTIAVVLSWLLLEIANRPEVQARIQKEIDEAVPENRLPSYDERLKLPYTEATTLESARLHTLVPFGVIHRTTRETDLGGLYLPKGCMVIPNLYSVHMDPDTWSDPENFRPERFLDGNNKIIGKENIVLFSLGKRSCMGEGLARQEVFVFFASLLQQFEIRPPEGVETLNIGIRPGITIEPMPYKIRFIPRKRK